MRMLLKWAGGTGTRKGKMKMGTKGELQLKQLIGVGFKLVSFPIFLFFFPRARYTVSRFKLRVNGCNNMQQTGCANGRNT